MLLLLLDYTNKETESSFFMQALCKGTQYIYIYIRETGQFSSKGIINDFIGNLNRLPIKHFNSVFTIFWDFIGNLNRL